MNKVLLIGRLGKEVETKYLQDGKAVANFTMATSEKWNDAQGQKVEKIEWHRVVAYGKLAEICGKYLEKGSQVVIEGKIHYKQWEDKDGNKHDSTDIIASNLEFVSTKKKEGVGVADAQKQDTEDVPF
jgi:single-strand DNA-binding protein